MRARLFTVRGKTRSISDWAQICGVSRERMRQRFNKYTPARAVMTESTKGEHMKSKMKGISQNRPLTINGETKLLKEWAKQAKVNPATICSRLGSGWTERDAVWVRPNMPRPTNGASDPFIVPAQEKPLDKIRSELARLMAAVEANRMHRKALEQEEAALFAEMKEIYETMAQWQADAISGTPMAAVAQGYADSH